MNPDPMKPPGSGQRRFYTSIAIVAALVVFAGFFRTFYLKGAFGTPALPALVQIHGVVMTLWFALFIVQVLLVARRRTDLHKRIGVFGALLAMLVLLVGTATSIAAARRGYTPGPPPLVFLAVPLVDLLVYAVLITTALLLRSRSDIHRRLMLVASLSLLTPAISRIPLDVIQAGGIPLFLGLTDLLLIGCALFDTVKHRRLHPAFGWGVALVIVSQPLRMLLANSSIWAQLAAWLVS